MEWWKFAYVAGESLVYKERFFVEATGTLPVHQVIASTETIFEAMTIKRIALRADQGIEE